MQSFGWIKLHRHIKQSWLWEVKPFSKAQAWIDILLSVNHKDAQVYSKGELKEVKAGSFLTSDNILAERWGWSRKAVRSFLALLEKDKMVTTVRTSKGTTLSVVNWDLYQHEGTIEDTTEGTTEGTTKVQAGYTNKNDKNENNKIIMQSEDIWANYPVKKGKVQAMEKIPKLIDQFGYEAIVDAVKRYKDYVEAQRKIFTDLQYQNGNTFFSGTYLDYIDDSYEEPEIYKTKIPSWGKVDS